MEEDRELSRSWSTTFCWVMGTAAVNTLLLLGWGAYSVRKKLKPRVAWTSSRMLSGMCGDWRGGVCGETLTKN